MNATATVSIAPAALNNLIGTSNDDGKIKHSSWMTSFANNTMGGATTMLDGIRSVQTIFSAVQEQLFQDKIRNYESDLRSPLFHSYINETVQKTLPSTNEIMKYYETRPELSQYTLEKELHRMNYAVVTHEGEKLTNSEEIKAYHQSQQESSNRKDENELIWRSANQSILGDILVALTSQDGLIRPQYEASTTVSNVTLVLDFHRESPTARAKCLLNLSIPSCDGERLSLVKFIVEVYFCPKQNNFRAIVSHMFPNKRLTDIEVNNAAKSLIL
mmetsp:Transcript_61818/g.85996  ORF Transcript_61818/g.85996 Transcript_61818/m.85996 type:complete len:273 (-) Transcript_61818:10-828(-)